MGKIRPRNTAIDCTLPSTFSFMTVERGKRSRRNWAPGQNERCEGLRAGALFSNARVQCGPHSDQDVPIASLLIRLTKLTSVILNNVLQLFFNYVSFYFQFSTLCIYMVMSKSGAKIRSGLFRAAWLCFSPSMICKGGYLIWLGRTC